MKLKNRKDYRVRRHLRLRQKIAGTAERPRMAIFISNAHMYVQLVDDDIARMREHARHVLRVHDEKTLERLGGRLQDAGGRFQKRFFV